MSLRTRHLTLQEKELREKLLPLLKGKLFHVTPWENYEEIRKSGKIKHNKGSEFEHCSGRPQYYGRDRSFVCLINLQSDCDVDEALLKYYFLYPFRERKPFSEQDKYVFLILDANKCPNLVSNKVAVQETGYKELFVPQVECWHQDHIPLGSISEALIVLLKRRPLPPHEKAIRMALGGKGPT